MTKQIKLYNININYHGFSYTAYVPYICKSKNEKWRENSHPNTYWQCTYLNIPTTSEDGYPDYHYIYSCNHKVYELGIAHKDINVIHERLNFIKSKLDMNECFYSKEPYEIYDCYNIVHKKYGSDEYCFVVKYEHNGNVYYDQTIELPNLEELMCSVERKLEILGKKYNVIQINKTKIRDYVTNVLEKKESNDDEIYINDVDDIEVIP